MAIMFVHGVPATARLWSRLIGRLDRTDEVVAVDLPGMSAPPPPGWEPTKERYVEWLIGEIEALASRSGGPIHLVGHDWGCILTLRAASLRPELLRSVAAGNGPIDPHWPLHAMWRIWATPGVGERCMDALGPFAAASAQRIGFPPEDAEASGLTTENGRAAILGLYRSATEVGTQWSADLARIVVPAMLLWGERDYLAPIEIGRRMATRIGAELVALDADHFWPYERPGEALDALKRLWARAERREETILTQDPDQIVRSLGIDS